ncbi:hypothetical protein [Actinoplanes sp. NPDC026670]|uniref:hypothetical protein n=1 Tax=Actinoplanes sp. NPDC026670 TaxID=3154700 RepID=UPI0033DFAB3A
MDQPAETTGANRRIAVTLFVAVLALLVLPCVLVVRPWQRYGVPVTVIGVVIGVGLVALFCALLYRSAVNRPDWNHARVATELTARGTVVVTITCTDLIPRGTFLSLTQDLRTAFEQPGHDGIVLTVEPLEGREHVLHLETTPPRLEGAMRVLRDAFGRHGIARIGPSAGP